MYTYTDLCLAHPLETWTPFDIVVNSAYALLTMPVTYKPTNVVMSPFIRYSGTSAYNIYIKVDTLVGCCTNTFSFSFLFSSFADRIHPSLAVGAVRLFELFCLRHGVPVVFEKISHGSLWQLVSTLAVSCPQRSYTPTNRRVDVWTRVQH